MSSSVVMPGMLARSLSESYVLNPIEEDADIIARLFGSAAKGGQGGKPSRLQFFDLKMTDDFPFWSNLLSCLFTNTCGRIS